MSEQHEIGERPHTKRNFRLTVANGGIVMFGSSFFATETVLAGLAHRLTGSSLCVGLLATAAGIGWMWPQLFVGNLVEHTKRKMPFYVVAAFFRFAMLLCLAALVYFWRGGDDRLYWMFLGVFTLFCSGGGAVGVPFFDIVAKAVPQRNLTMMWAYRRLLGGLLGFLGGVVVARILSEKSGLTYPANYALLFVIGAAVCSVAYVMFICVREPIEPVAPKRVPFLTYLKRGPVIFRGDHDFRRLYLFRWTWALGAMSQTLLVPFANEQFDAPAKQAGWFTAAILLVGGLAAYGWGRLAQRKGETFVLWASSVLLFAAPATALALALAARGPEPLAAFLHAHYLWPFLAMFAIGTAALNGNIIAGIAYLLSLPTSPLRPAYVGFINTLSIPLLFAPVLAGAVAQYISYTATFAISCVFSLLAIFVASKLRTRKEGHYPDLPIE